MCASDPSLIMDEPVKITAASSPKVYLRILNSKLLIPESANVAETMYVDIVNSNTDAALASHENDAPRQRNPTKALAMLNSASEGRWSEVWSGWGWDGRGGGERDGVSYPTKAGQ